MAFEISEHSIEKIPHCCIIKLQAVYDSLKTAEKKAADLLIEEPEFFATASIVEAASKARCSEATLVRLAQKLGYSGYLELKNHLLTTKDNVPVELYEGITEDDDYESVVTKVFQTCIQALIDTRGVLGKDEYKKSVEVMCSADKIMFCGAGDASSVAYSAYQKFIRKGQSFAISFNFFLY